MFSVFSNRAFGLLLLAIMLTLGTSTDAWSLRGLLQGGPRGRCRPQQGRLNQVPCPNGTCKRAFINRERVQLVNRGGRCRRPRGNPGPQCGDIDQQVCPNGTCKRVRDQGQLVQLINRRGICKLPRGNPAPQCGAIGEQACPKRPFCDVGAVRRRRGTNFICEALFNPTCGSTDLPPCPGSGCNQGLAPVDDDGDLLCQPCGGVGQPTCRGRCNFPQLSPVNGPDGVTCELCGGPRQAPCRGNQCQRGLGVVPGGEDEPPFICDNCGGFEEAPCNGRTCNRRLAPLDDGEGVIICVQCDVVGGPPCTPFRCLRFLEYDPSTQTCVTPGGGGDK